MKQATTIKIIGVCLGLLCVGCRSVNDSNEKVMEHPIEAIKDSVSVQSPNPTIPNTPAVKEEKVETPVDLSNLGLIDVQSIEPKVQVELKYATTDNFTGKQMYFVLKNAFLQKDVANQLKKAQTYLEEKHPGYALLIYDAARPVEVQQRMWDALAHVPVSERTKFVSNPKNHSIHNYGAAVDLTIVDETGKPLDMGAKYDEIEQIAYPRLESEFLKKGLLTEQHIANRQLLRDVMTKAGFRNIATEWWHFNACTREQAKAKYSVFLKEPQTN